MKNDQYLIQEIDDGHWDLGDGGRSGPWIAIQGRSADNQGVVSYVPWTFYVGGATSVFCLALTVFTLTRFGVLPSTRMVLCRLGWTQAAGLESDSPNHLPDDPTGENARKRP